MGKAIFKKELYDLLIKNAYNVWRLSLQNTGTGIKAFNYLRDIKEGDCVLEISSTSRKSCDSTRFGELVKIEIGENEYSTVYHIRTITGKVITWSNAEFIKVPKDILRSGDY